MIILSRRRLKFQDIGEKIVMKLTNMFLFRIKISQIVNENNLIILLQRISKKKLVQPEHKAFCEMRTYL